MRVVIAGMYAPYPGPFDGCEIWGVNRCYVHQENLARLYFLDSLAGFKRHHPEFVQCVNDLGIPVYAQRRYEEIPMSREYPLLAVLRKMFGDIPDDELKKRGYFTSTIAYMLAHAIAENMEEIVLHRILVNAGSSEYLMQKSCLDFWCGVAVGRGHKLLISEDSNLCKPVPWEPRFYGYEENSRFDDANDTITSGVRAAMRIPVEMRPATD